MIDEALKYLTKHKLVPLPCMGGGDSKGKIPLIKWQAIQELPTEAQVREWFTKNPNTNIGFKTGKVSGILVLDNDGVTITEPMPLTPTSTSRPGHFHSYFMAPDFYVPPSASKIGPHLDIRCDQAFIVAPPSKHFNKETGEVDGEYNWVDGMSPDDIPFAPCPDWLVLRIKETLTNAHGFDWSGALNVGTGARDDTLTRAAASLVAKGFEEDTALGILRGINATYDPPLPDDLVINKLETAIGFINSQKKKETEEKFNEINARNPYKEIVDLRALQYLTYPTLLQDLKVEDYKYDFIWENYLAFGHITTLSSHPKVGKSTLMGNLLKAMEQGEEFLGQPTRYTPVLIVSEESEHHWVQRQKKLDFKNPIRIWCSPLSHKLSNKEWEDFVLDVKNLCNALKIKFVIFDTISKFWSVRQENEAADMDAAFLPLNILKMDGFAVLVIHHFRKSGGEYGQGARGSSVFGATPDCLVDFMRVDDGHPSLRKIKAVGRFPNTPEDITIEYTGKFYQPSGSLKTIKELEQISYLIDLITEITQENGVGATAQDIYEAWNEDNGKVPAKRTIQQIMKDKCKSGVFTVVGKKKVGKTEALIYGRAQNHILSIEDARDIVPTEEKPAARVIEPIFEEQLTKELEELDDD